MAKRLSADHWKQVFDSKDGEPYLHLEKANSKGICHCTCERALAAVPSQMDCPWCGCGWLICCSQCGKAFTYAKPVVIHTPLETIVEMDMLGRGYKKDNSFFAEAAGWMKELLAEIEEDQEYIYLDGYFIPVDAEDFSIEGMHANHQITELPHSVELKSPGALSRTLGETEYWEERRREEDEDDGDESDDDTDEADEESEHRRLR